MSKLILPGRSGPSSNRRRVLGGMAAAGGLAAFPSPFVKRAFGQARNTMVFASAEPVTGNWDPTSHTTLAQINLEGFVFGQLIRTPMRPDNPAEIVYELATSQEVLDLHTIEYKLRDGVTFHNGAPFTRRGRQGDLRVRLAAGAPGRLVSGAVRGRGGRPAHRPRPHRDRRLSGGGLLLPRRLPADHVEGRHRRRDDAAGAPERHRPLQVRRAARQHHRAGGVRRLHARQADPRAGPLRLCRRCHDPRPGAARR